MSISETKAALLNFCGSLPHLTLMAAHRELEQRRAELAQLCQSSNSAEMHAALAMLARGGEEILAAFRTVAEADRLIETYAYNL